MTLKGKIFLGFFLASFCSIQWAYSQSLVETNIDFGQLNVGKKDSQLLHVNLGKYNQLKIEIRLYGNAFSTQQNSKTLTRNSDTSFWVVFNPEQNIAYLGAVFVGYNGIWQIAGNLVGNGKIANSYYNSTFNLWDDDLLKELKTITSKGQKSLGYNGARDEMYGDLDNVNGKVTCAYTGRTASFNSRGGANDNSFNCEHTWPQSKFCSGESSTMKADIHHLFATDVSANSKRGSYPFGKVTGSTTWQEGGSKLGGGIFEPRNEQKGATARAMMYMVMRYGDCDGFLNTQENTFRNWSSEFEPSQKEKGRNDGIYSLQKNRNPFVDAPELLDRIIALKGNKTRKTEPMALLVDTMVELMAVSGDSAIYIAYIVNTGTDVLNITEVEGDIVNYTLFKNKLKPGEKTGIRMVLNYPVGGLYGAYIKFKEPSLSQIEVNFEPTVGIYKPLISKALNLVVDHNYLIVASEFDELSIYETSGKLVLNTSNTYRIDVAALKQDVYIVVLRNGNQFRSTKIILR